MFHQGVTNALLHRALHLAFRALGIDHAPDVMGIDHVFNPHLAGFNINLHLHKHCPARYRAYFRVHAGYADNSTAERGGIPLRPLGGVLHQWGISPERDLPDAYRRIGAAFDEHLAIPALQVPGIGLQHGRRDLKHFQPGIFRGLPDCGAGRVSAATGMGRSVKRHVSGIDTAHPHLFKRNAKLFCHHLAENRVLA